GQATWPGLLIVAEANEVLRRINSPKRRESCEGRYKTYSTN
ncbi:MAG: hypothetical protein K0R55_4524, partial [Sporomusa sp.]|nr:hypothetical protein [Sporomusa sp.]